MASENKPRLVPTLLFLAAIFILQHSGVDGDNPQVPCLFIFGDSLSDSGNNNPLPTAAKANYKPYGIDFPNETPTGRFTNGRTSIDIITQLLGFENFIPPFVNTSGSDILKGVNYASGAAGILVESGTKLGANINFGLQLTNHREIVSQIAAKLGSIKQAKQHLNQCLYYVNIGANDYLNNYFMPEQYPTSKFFNLEQYAQDLLRKYSLTLRGLHETGARKFVLVGVGLLGYTPHAMSRAKSSSWVEVQNNAALIFNSKLKSLVDLFNNELSNSKFIFVNSTAGIIGQSLGFKVVNAGCCEVREDGQCVAGKTPCENRKEYVFWDSFHPTEAVNLITAIASYNASNPSFTYPMDISHLVQA